MSKISRSLAEDIATKLVVKLDEESKSINKEIEDILYEETIKLVPKDIMNIFNENKQWINYTNASYFSFRSNHVYYNLRRDYPYNKDKNIVITDDEICEKLELLKNKDEKLKKKRKDLHKEVADTILSLNTTNKIKEFFPEAAVYLPGEKMEIAINIDSTREKVNTILL